MGLGARIVYAAAAALVTAGVLFAAVRKWQVGNTNKDEIALFGGLAVGVIVFLLLTPQVPAQVTEQPAAGAAPNVPPLPAVVYNPGTFNVTPYQPQKPGGCGCGCGPSDNQLTYAFTKIAQQFGASMSKTEQDYTAALMSSVPNWLSQYYNNPVGVQASVVLQDFYGNISNL